MSKDETEQLTDRELVEQFVVWLASFQEHLVKLEEDREREARKLDNMLASISDLERVMREIRD